MCACASIGICVWVSMYVYTYRYGCVYIDIDIDIVQHMYTSTFVETCLNVLLVPYANVGTMRFTAKKEPQQHFPNPSKVQVPAERPPEVWA